MYNYTYNISTHTLYIQLYIYIQYISHIQSSISHMYTAYPYNNMYDIDP